MIVAGTGHRPDKLGGYGPSAIQEDVRRRIRAALVYLKPSRVISGFALGFDQWLVEEADPLGIPVTAAIPFVGQESRWTREAQRHYRDLLGWCDEQVIVSPGGYSAEKMHARNRWMVNRCGILLAAWDGSDGGTGGTVRYAKSIGRRIARIDPTRRPLTNC